ncbi:MAG: acetyl-CoA carboxylase biotin carboxylase subunit, partial [Candidatus Kapabacteria bacterium]|nr:acetyl-CoA carboxylase biotin carboxylase subunit [Candidatus Kapabacteria bacterium]
FKKILIANRGEIALRVIRTCKRLGIATVAVYSDADVHSMHVTEADETIAIGGYTPRESYLVMEKILNAIAVSGADAVHPGYGFLSENEVFAKKVAEAGCVFIGPTPDAINALGDKTAARELAITNSVPVAPGSDGAIEGYEPIRELAATIGYPVMIKAAAGGGGKGMRAVFSEEELRDGLAAAQGEALTSFNDARVFVERYIQNPRHIEIQVLADNHGNVLYFPERECSIQRRHQKVIEESPSTAVTPEIRKAMGEAGARLVRASKYTNAGTIEFLLDTDGSFYFMEVNTRLQVEHPVTEMISGVDFVEQQIRIAAGLPLEITQSDIQEPKGHAIECRICAEDVFSGFLPDTGVVEYLNLPEGDGIRNDSGLYVGYEVSVHYDPMVAKLIVHAENRAVAMQRTVDALKNYGLSGFRTTIPFCIQVIESEQFQSGDYSTKYVERHWHDSSVGRNAEALSAIAALVYDDYSTRRTA